jgi:hypothetical protein
MQGKESGAEITTTMQTSCTPQTRTYKKCVVCAASQREIYERLCLLVLSLILLYFVPQIHSVMSLKCSQCHKTMKYVYFKSAMRKIMSVTAKWGGIDKLKAKFYYLVLFSNALIVYQLSAGSFTAEAALEYN